MRPIDPKAVLAIHVPKWETMTADELRHHIRYTVDAAHKKVCQKACQILRPYVPPPMPQRRGRPVVRRGKPVVAPSTPTPTATRKPAKPKTAASKKTKTTGGSD